MGFEVKPLWVFSYSLRDKAFMGFPYEYIIDGLSWKKPFSVLLY